MNESAYWLWQSPIALAGSPYCTPRYQPTPTSSVLAAPSFDNPLALAFRVSGFGPIHAERGTKSKSARGVKGKDTEKQGAEQERGKEGTAREGEGGRKERDRGCSKDQEW